MSTGSTARRCVALVLSPRGLDVRHQRLFRFAPSEMGRTNVEVESAASLKVLDEWISSGSGDRIKAAALLVSNADPSFAFKHVGFVSNLLERAQAASYDCYQSVSSNLDRSALSGIRSGTPGLPMPEDVAMRDQAAAVANRFDSGSPTFRFYDSLAKSAEANISPNPPMDRDGRREDSGRG